MNQVRMVTVDRVLDLELPVARVAVLAHARAYVEFAFGRQIDEQVDLILGRAQMFIERDSVRRDAPEHEPAVGSHPWNFGKAQLFFAQRSAIAVLIGNSAQLTVVPVAPAVVGASEELCVPLRRPTYGSGPMAASVEQEPHLATVITHHNHGGASDLPQPIVTRLWNFAGVPHVDPSSMKDLGDLVLEDIGIEINPAVDPVVTDQRIVVDGLCRHAGLRAGDVAKRFAQAIRFTHSTKLATGLKNGR